MIFDSATNMRVFYVKMALCQVDSFSPPFIFMELTMAFYKRWVTTQSSCSRTSKCVVWNEIDLSPTTLLVAT